MTLPMIVATFDEREAKHLMKMLGSLGEEGFTAVNRALAPVGRDLAEWVAIAAPVRPASGALQDSITYMKRAKKAQGFIALRVGAQRGRRFPHPDGGETKDGKPREIDPSYYLHLVEFGTRHSRARPFIRKVLERRGPKIAEHLFQTVTDRVEKAWARKFG
jgi:HK97 gp10 family phage protein